MRASSKTAVLALCLSGLIAIPTWAQWEPAQGTARAHPYVGKTCTAQGHSTGSIGSNTGRFELQFAADGGITYKWFGDSGRTAGSDDAAPYAGVENGLHVWRHRSGGTFQIDAAAGTGEQRTSRYVTRFWSLKCT
jgi:hypothetical protein